LFLYNHVAIHVPSKKCFCSRRGIVLEKINAFEKYIFL